MGKRPSIASNAVIRTVRQVVSELSEPVTHLAYPKTIPCASGSSFE
jgi:hypothetical protein